MRPPAPPDYPKLVGAIYEAALLTDDWTDVFERIRRLTGVVAAGIKVETECDMVQTWVGLPGGFAHAFAEHYWRLDPWTRGSKRWKPGTCLVSSALVPDEDLRASEFYNDLCVPHGLYDAIGGCLDDDTERYVTFGMMRPHGARGGGEREAALVQPLFPHLQRAVRLGMHTELLKTEVRSLRAAVDAVRVAVLVVDVDRRVLYANAAAAAVLRRDDGLREAGGKLTCSDAGLAAALATTVAGREPGAPHVLRIDRRGSSSPYGVVISPAHRGIREAVRHGEPAAMLYVFDPDADLAPPPEILRELFGLTATETQVALRLAAGRTLGEIATELGSSLPTVRTHLRQIFDKTATHRQADLVSLLVSLGTVAVPASRHRTP